MTGKKGAYKKIGFLIPSMTWGGAELQLIKTLKLFGQHGFDPHLIVSGTHLDLLDQINLQPEKILCLKNKNLNFLTSKSSLSSIPSAWRIMIHLRQHKVRILIAYLPLSHWIARWATLISWATLFPIRILLYHHSEQFAANPPTSLGMKLFHKFNIPFGFLCDHAHIFISNASFLDFRKKQFVRNHHVIYNFICKSDVSVQQAQAFIAAKTHLEFDKLLVIPGRLHPVKGQIFFLNATARYLTKEKMKNDKILLVFAGGGVEEGAIQKKTENLGIKDFTITTGFIDNELLLSFLKLAHLVIIPSLFEGLGNVAIEALMLRRNVLCSNAGGLTEVIGSGKFSVSFKAGDSNDLLIKLTAILDGQVSMDPESGYQRYRDNFTSEVYLKNWQSILKKL